MTLARDSETMGLMGISKGYRIQLQRRAGGDIVDSSIGYFWR